jgi:ribonuclease VapC
MYDYLVIDTYAIISFLRKEENHLTIKRIFEESRISKTTLLLSDINWGEVYYITLRNYGEPALRKTLGWMDAMEFQILVSKRERIQAAARIKARFPVSYADAFAIAAAREFDCPVVTGDPEFRRVEQAGMVKLMWMGA